MATNLDRSYFARNGARERLDEDEGRWPPFASFCLATLSSFVLWGLLIYTLSLFLAIIA